MTPACQISPWMVFHWNKLKVPLCLTQTLKETFCVINKRQRHLTRRRFFRRTGSESHFYFFWEQQNLILPDGVQSTINYTIAACSNVETAYCSVSATSRHTSSCSVSNRMSHSQFENMIRYCTTAAVLALAGALAPLAEAPLSLDALTPSPTSNSHISHYVIMGFHCGTCTHWKNNNPLK